jgi:hypothetical protein
MNAFWPVRIVNQSRKRPKQISPHFPSHPATSFDLKTSELTHQDVGQMDMYVVRYSVLHGNEQLFATKYKLILPTEDELRAELVREQQMLTDLPTETENEQ